MPVRSYCMQYDSMEPTVSTGIDLLADHEHYTRNRPQRWDVVVFSLPAEVADLGPQAGRYLKRVIGLPGETIQIRPEGLWINGSKAIVPPRLVDRFSSFKQFPEHKFAREAFRIPDDSVFLIGDNPRIYVADSRQFGPIPVRNIEARVMASVRTDPIA